MKMFWATWISLPLLGDVQAAGLTALQLAELIHKGLTEYLTNPSVTVTVRGFGRSLSHHPDSRLIHCHHRTLSPNVVLHNVSRSAVTPRLNGSSARERGLSLNPHDAAARAFLGLLTACAGEWGKGCEIVESARRLNPNCPGYFYFAQCWSNYRLGKYDRLYHEVIARTDAK
jgi:Polysaccharide biosynthesis/export protein